MSDSYEHVLIEDQHSGGPGSTPTTASPARPRPARTTVRRAVFVCAQVVCSVPIGRFCANAWGSRPVRPSDWWCGRGQWPAEPRLWRGRGAGTGQRQLPVR
jgi:hypothetical protein